MGKRNRTNRDEYEDDFADDYQDRWESKNKDFYLRARRDTSRKKSWDEMDEDESPPIRPAYRKPR